MRAWLLVLVASLFTQAAASHLVAESRTLDRGWCAAVLKPSVDRQELAGAVMLVADRSQILDLETVGWADIEAQRPMTEETMFWIASQSKPMAAAALMLLVDEGGVSLDDPVEKYLPEFQSQMVQVESDAEHQLLRRPMSRITVRQLLSHSSGLPFKSGLEEPTLDLYPLSARVRSYAMTPLVTSPGTDFLYSNAGINTAARIIEVVTSQPFEAFLDERLLQPLNMRDTTFWPSDEQVARLATAYRPADDKQSLAATPIAQLHYPLTDRRERTPMPAGGLFSTAGDVCRFYQMLLNDGELDGRRYLTSESVRELTRRQTPADWKENYGLGFKTTDTTFGHGGAYSTNSFADRERGLIFVWLVQHAGFIGEGAKCQEVFRTTATERLTGAQNP